MTPPQAPPEALSPEAPNQKPRVDRLTRVAELAAGFCLCTTVFLAVQAYNSSSEIAGIEASIATVEEVHERQGIDASGLTSPASQPLRRAIEASEAARRQANGEVVGALKADLRDEKIEFSQQRAIAGAGLAYFLLCGTAAMSQPDALVRRLWRRVRENKS